MPQGNGRLAERCTLGEVLRLFGWTALFVSCVILSKGVAAALFAADPEFPDSSTMQVLEQLRLLVGVAGMSVLAVGMYARTWSEKRLPLSRAYLALGLVTAMLCLGVAEAFARVREWRKFGSLVSIPLPIHSLRREGESYLQPGSYALPTGSDFDPERNQVAFITINRYGLRGALPALPKPPGRTRIICIGGSTTFGFVSEGEDWPARLQSLLSAHGDFEVINAGRPGATTWSDFRYLRDRLAQLEPDVLLLFEGFNDLWRGVRRHSAEQGDYGGVDLELPAGEESLDLGESRSGPVRFSFATYLIGRVLESWIKEPDVPVGPRLAPGQFRFDPAVVSIYQSNLAAMIQFSRKHGIQPIVVTFVGCDDARRPPDEQRLCLKYVLDNMPQLDVERAQEGLDLYRQVTREVAHEQNAAVIDAAARMTKDMALYGDTVHLTPEGEDQLARVIAPEILDLLGARKERPGEALPSVGN